MNKPILFFAVKLAALAAAVLTLVITDNDIVRIIIMGLTMACLVILLYLFEHLIKKKSLTTGVLFVLLILCIYEGRAEYFPFIVTVIFQLCDIFTQNRMFYYIYTVCILLSLMIFEYNKISFLFAAVIIALTIISRILIMKVEFLNNQCVEQMGIITEQKKRLHEMKNYTKTLRTTISMEERNRFAARIHDRLGHNISGSIILLEAALLSLKKSPEKAEETIRTAAENLRKGVDDIRHALREERPDRTSLGVTEIKEKLENFSVLYNKETGLKTTGNLENIPSTVWVCICENLEEALTNTLKHSKATRFEVSINVLNKIIRVEYKDNGYAGESINKGIGLEAIEERTAASGGRCILSSGINGFSIISIFTI